MFAGTEGGGRRGFALPFAVLTLALITAAVVAAFSSTSAETVANNAMRAQDRAYQLAEAGMQQFILRRTESGFCANCVPDPAVADSEWTTVSLTGGYAHVVTARLRAAESDGTPAMFFIRSTGVDTSVRLSGGGNAVYATRTLGMYVTWGTAPIQVLGALTLLNGVTNTSAVPGNDVAISGNDACGSASNRAGVVAPKGGGYTGAGERPDGSPRVDSSMTVDSLLKRVAIDWDGIVNRDAIPADFTYPAGAWPSTSDFNSYPVTRVTGSTVLPTTGKGLLIVDSNLTIASNHSWDGVILVGGSVNATGTGTIEGAVVTGLNRLLPNAPADLGLLDNDLLSNRNRFRYSSCQVVSAAQKLDRYYALTNTWMDNVAIW